MTVRSIVRLTVNTVNYYTVRLLTIRLIMMSFLYSLYLFWNYFVSISTVSGLSYLLIAAETPVFLPPGD